jgi:hypothetical protein
MQFKLWLWLWLWLGPGVGPGSMPASPGAKCLQSRVPAQKFQPTPVVIPQSNSPASSSTAELS